MLMSWSFALTPLSLRGGCGLICVQSAVALLLYLSHQLPFFLCLYSPSSSFLLVFLLCQQDTKSSPLLPPDLLNTLADFEEEEELVFSKPPGFFQVSVGPLSSAPGPNMFVCTQNVITCSSPVSNTFKHLRLEIVRPPICSRLRRIWKPRGLWLLQVQMGEDQVQNRDGAVGHELKELNPICV